MSKHTPAPWSVHFRTDGSIYISMGDPNRGPHKAADLFLTADGGESDREDARLIAAAPELLEALIVMEQEKSEYMTKNNLGDPSVEHTNIMARAAIAKATGEA